MYTEAEYDRKAPVVWVPLFNQEPRRSYWQPPEGTGAMAFGAGAAYGAAALSGPPEAPEGTDGPRPSWSGGAMPGPQLLNCGPEATSCPAGAAIEVAAGADVAVGAGGGVEVGGEVGWDTGGGV